MEKKKLLLVAVSVGIFLVIVIGAAIVLSSKQNDQVTTAAANPVYPGSAGINGVTVEPGTSSAPAQPAAPVTDPAHTPTSDQPASVDTNALLRNPDDVNSLKPAPGEKTPASINYFYGETIYSDVRVEKYTPEAAKKPAEAPRAAAAEPVPAAPPKAAASPAQKPAAAAPVQPAPKPAATKVYTDYWVQTGSFSTKARADGVKESLAAKGISSVIEVRNIDAKTWYRVRVGPYTSQKEAEYWLSLIKSMNGFEESQVWSSQSRR